MINGSSNDADFQDYLSLFRPDLSGFTFDVFAVDGGVNSQTGLPNFGANTVTQVAAGLASKVPMLFIIVGLDNLDGPVNAPPISAISDVILYRI